MNSRPYEFNQNDLSTVDAVGWPEELDLYRLMADNDKNFENHWCEWTEFLYQNWGSSRLWKVNEIRQAHACSIREIFSFRIRLPWAKTTTEARFNYCNHHPLPEAIHEQR